VKIPASISSSRVQTANALLECSISSTTAGRASHDHQIRAGLHVCTQPMQPIKKSELKLISQTGMQTGMMYKFDAFPAAAFKARFKRPWAEGTIIEMKSEVEVAVARFSQAGGPGTPIHFTAEDIAPDSAYVEFTECLFEPAIANHSPFACFFGAWKMERGWSFLAASRPRLPS